MPYKDQIPCFTSRTQMKSGITIKQRNNKSIHDLWNMVEIDIVFIYQAIDNSNHIS